MVVPFSSSTVWNELFNTPLTLSQLSGCSSKNTELLESELLQEPEDWGFFFTAITEYICRQKEKCQTRSRIKQKKSWTHGSRADLWYELAASAQATVSFLRPHSHCTATCERHKGLDFSSLEKKCFCKSTNTQIKKGQVSSHEEFVQLWMASLWSLKPATDVLLFVPS